VTVSAAQDIFEIQAPTDAVVRVVDWTILQTSDVGDAQEEILRIETVRGIGSTTGSGGTTPTSQPIEDGDTAFGGVVKANNTTRMTGGTLETLEQRAWNVRMPIERIYTPETCPVVSPGNRWTLALPAAPADPVTLSAMITFEEWGG
jgi:hypothetical protein